MVYVTLWQIQLGGVPQHRPFPQGVPHLNRALNIHILHGCIWITCWLWAEASPPEGYISTVPLRNIMDMLYKKTGSGGEGTRERTLCLWRAWIQMDFNVDWQIAEMLKKKRNSSPCTVTMEREAPNHRVHSTCSDSTCCISP